MDIRTVKILRMVKEELSGIEYPEDDLHRHVCLTNAIEAQHKYIREGGKRRRETEDKEPRKRMKMTDRLDEEKEQDKGA